MRPGRHRLAAGNRFLHAIHSAPGNPDRLLWRPVAGGRMGRMRGREPALSQGPAAPGAGWGGSAWEEEAEPWPEGVDAR